MSYPLSTYVAQIAVAEDGNPQITVRRRNTTGTEPADMHPNFPPMAVPAAHFPDALATEGYAESLIRTAGLLDNNGQQGLVWVSSGHTIVNGQRMAARTAAIRDPEPTA